MSVSDGQTGNATVFNAAFVSRTANTGTSGILALTNAAPASGPSITNLQGAVNDALTDIAGFEARITDIEDNTFTFAGNKTFSGNVVIAGNLTVQGTTTAIDTDNLEVEDRNILINKGGNDATSEGAGLTVQRTALNGSFVFDSNIPSFWKLGILGSEKEVIVSDVDQTIGGSKTFTSKINSFGGVKFFDSDQDFGVSIFAADETLEDYDIKLPPEQGMMGDTLVNDGMGNLSWQPGGGGGGGSLESTKSDKLRINFADLVALGAISNATTAVFSIPEGSVLKSVTAKVVTQFEFGTPGATSFLIDVGTNVNTSKHILDFQILDQPFGAYSSKDKSNEVVITPENNVVVELTIIDGTFDQLTAGVLDIYIEYYDAEAAPITQVLGFT